jgi:hypothetical protein
VTQQVTISFFHFLLLVCRESRHAVVAELRHAALLKGYSAHKSRVQALQNEVDQAHLTASLFRARPVKPNKEKPNKKTAGGVNTKGKGTKTTTTKAKGSKGGQGKTRRKGTGGMMTGRTGVKSKKGSARTTDREEAKGHETNKDMTTKPLTKYNLGAMGEDHNAALIRQIDKRTSTRNRTAAIEVDSDSDSTASASDVDDEWVPRRSQAKIIRPDDPPTQLDQQSAEESDDDDEDERPLAIDREDDLATEEESVPYEINSQGRTSRQLGGRVKYQVRWLINGEPGPLNTCTWELASELEGDPAYKRLIDDWKQRRPAKWNTPAWQKL